MGEAWYQAQLDIHPADSAARLLLGEWLTARGDGRGPGYAVLAERHLYPHEMVQRRLNLLVSMWFWHQRIWFRRLSDSLLPAGLFGSRHTADDVAARMIAMGPSRGKPGDGTTGNSQKK